MLIHFTIGSMPIILKLLLDFFDETTGHYHQLSAYM